MNVAKSNFSVEHYLRKVLGTQYHSNAMLYDHPLYQLIEREGLIGLRNSERYWLGQLGGCRNPVGASLIHGQIKKLRFLRQAIYGDETKLTAAQRNQLSIFVAALEAEDQAPLKAKDE